MATSLDQLLARATALESRLARLELQNVALYHRIEAIIQKQPGDTQLKDEFLARVREQVFGPNLFTSNSTDVVDTRAPPE